MTDQTSLRCSECGQWLVETPSGFLSCPDMHGKLIERLHGSHYYIRLRAAKREEWLHLLLSAKRDAYAGRKYAFKIEGRCERFTFDPDRSRARILEAGEVALLRGEARRFVAIKEDQ